MHIECVCSAGALLGEGALWDPVRGVVWWVDIKRPTLHAHHVATGRNHAQRLDMRITALGLAEHDALVAAGDPGFLRLAVQPDFSVRVEAVIACPDEPPGNRFNDGKVDAAGRFWAGTMHDDEQLHCGRLYRLAGRDITCVRSGIAVPNGPCFLEDGTMLTTDTARRVIHALSLDSHGNPVSERLFARFEPQHGYPDGMTVDEQNHVWVAFWDGACLRRLDPQGRVVQEIALPVRSPTCPVFAHPELDCLYVTSAAIAVDPAGRAPGDGGLLRVDVGVRGRPPPRFSWG